MSRVIIAVAILTLASAPALAQKEDVTELYAVEFDAGLLTGYDDSGIWSGGYDVGVTVLRSRSASTSFCARFGLSHWSYASSRVVEELVPDDAEITTQQSTGQLQILTLTPMLHYQRDKVLGALGAFVEGGVGIAYVKTFALTEVLYEAGALGTQLATFEINESDVFAEVRLCAGLSRAVSTSSWLDLIPTYRVIFADETAHVLGLAIGFRARV